jgi:hypothetical protein
MTGEPAGSVSDMLVELGEGNRDYRRSQVELDSTNVPPR